MRGSVVVIHPGALGDVLLAVPAIRRLRIRYPGHELVLIASSGISQLLSKCHEIDQWMSIEDQNCIELFGNLPRLSGRLQAWLERCELAVAWLEDKEDILTRVFEQNGVKKRHIQSPFSRELSEKHQSHRFLESIGEMPTVSEATHVFQVQHEQVEQARTYLETYAIPPDHSIVLIHPGSGSVRKCSRPDVMASLVHRLRDNGRYPLILEGPADHEVVERMLQAVEVKPVVLRGLDLPLLAGILTMVDWYVGHDSGVTHLAAALGVKTVAIFGPTDHRRWAPQGTHVTVVRGLPCTCHTWESVGQCIHQACLDISIETLLQSVGDHLQSFNDYKPL